MCLPCWVWACTGNQDIVFDATHSSHCRRGTRITKRKMSPSSITEEACLIITTHKGAYTGCYSPVSSWGSDNHIKSRTGKPTPGTGRFHIPNTTEINRKEIQCDWKKSLMPHLSLMITSHYPWNDHVRVGNFGGCAESLNMFTPDGTTDVDSSILNTRGKIWASGGGRWKPSYKLI